MKAVLSLRSSVFRKCRDDEAALKAEDRRLKTED